MMLTLNGMFSEPKPHRINFIKENKKKLKQIGSSVSQDGKQAKVNPSKSQCSQPVVDKSIQQSPSKHRSVRKPSVTGSKILRKGSSTQEDKNETISVRMNPKTSSRNFSLSKNQSCQTIDPKKCDQLFHEGIIKYPSNKILQELEEVEKQKSKRLDAHVRKEFLKRNKIKHKTSPVVHAKQLAKEQGKGDMPESAVTDNQPEEEKNETAEKEENIENEPPAQQLIEPETPKEKDQQIPINAAEIIRRTTEDHIQYSPRISQRSGFLSDRALNNDVKPSKKSLIKKSISKGEETALKMVMDPLCPPGHIPLPDQERKKTLHMLRVSYAELVREMNLLPVRTDTLRVRQKKIQLENQLNKIEEGIKVFSKSKVYVKVEE